MSANGRPITRLSSFRSSQAGANGKQNYLSPSLTGTAESMLHYCETLPVYHQQTTTPLQGVLICLPTAALPIRMND